MAINIFKSIRKFFSKKKVVKSWSSRHPGINIRKLYDNLLTTKHYCEDQLRNTENETSKTFRSFNPFYNGSEIFKFNASTNGAKELSLAQWTIDPLTGENDDLIPELFIKQLKHKNETTTWTKSSMDFKGRILVAKFDYSVVDGVSEWESDGLIDGYDLPPIDTWFYLLKSPQGIRQMYAWIPKQFILLAQNAIDVNCVECLQWYEE